MMKSAKVVLVLGLLLGLCSDTCLAITLVRDGEPSAVIVVAGKARPSVTYAVEELRHHIELVTGAKLSVLPVSQVEDKTQPLVLVGPSELTTEMGLRADTLPFEGYMVATRGNRLVLMGRDKDPKTSSGRVLSNPFYMEVQTGTLYAVYAFLDKVVGVKWLWPSDLGTTYPKHKTLRVKDYHLVSRPRLVRRGFASSINSGHVRKSAANILGKKRAEQMRHESKVWMTRHMVGTRVFTHAGHAFTHWYERYIKDHPDWLAMYPDGERYIPPGADTTRIKLCVSNPEVRAQIVKDAIKGFERAPYLASFSACPNDSDGYCMCSTCKAWDDPNGPPIRLSYFTKTKGSVTFPYVALTDRYAKFWTKLAEELVKTHPDKYVFAYAYSKYRTPPVSTKIHPNVIIAYVGFDYVNRASREADLDQWRKWAHSGCSLYLRPNYLEVGHGFPLNFARRVGEDLKMCTRTGMIGTMIGWWENHWATQGLNMYVIARMLEDPGRDVDAVIAEYCRAGFRRAAPAIREYFDRMEEATDQVYLGKITAETRTKSHALWGYVFDADVVRDGRLMLYKARQMEDDPAVQKRIDFLAKGLDYAELSGRALVKTYELASSGKDPMGAVNAVLAKEQFYRQQLTDWAVNVPTLRYREWSKKFKSYYGLDVAEQLKGKNVFQVLNHWKFALDRKEVGEQEGWYKPSFDDSQWDTLRAGEWWEKQGYGGGPKKDDHKTGYNGIAWYRKLVTIPETMKGKTITLRFGAIDESGWIYVNGTKVAEIIYDPVKNPDSYTTPVEVDVTKVLNYGKPTVIAVRVEDRDGAGGLWRLVSLQVVE